MTTVWNRTIEGIYCPKCHTQLVFDEDSVFSPMATDAHVMMRCPACGRHNYRVTISIKSENTFYRKNTRREGLRADYEDAYSAIRFLNRIHHGWKGAFDASVFSGISFSVCLRASDSYWSRNTDLLANKEIVRENRPEEPDDLPF